MSDRPYNCLLDLDGVLVDFIAGLAKLRGGPRVDPTSWDCVTPNEWSRMDYTFWRYLPKTPEFDLILSAVEETFGQENVCLLTSPARTQGCLEGKMDWIREHLPQYSRQFLIGPVKHFCAHDRAVLIDDSEDNCNAFNKAGGDIVLLPRPWNFLRGVKIEDTMNFVRSNYDLGGEANL